MLTLLYFGKKILQAHMRVCYNCLINEADASDRNEVRT